MLCLIFRLSPLFLSTLSLRRATLRHCTTYLNCSRFLSTLSLRRATSSKIISSSIRVYFYPRSPCGERRKPHKLAGRKLVFLSTLSLRRATDTSALMKCQVKFLSTLSLRRATFKPPVKTHRQKHFYPRSPCGERLRVLDGSKSSIEISIHALLAESDDFSGTAWVQEFPFLSTLSLRRATALRQLQSALRRNFYPRSPCGERPRPIPAVTRVANFYPRSPCGERQPEKSESLTTYFISIHALLAESDHNVHPDTRRHDAISIHALLAESDISYIREPRQSIDFYPRSPCGERLEAKRTTDIRPLFLSTLSLRRATNGDCNYRSARPISIHALLAESDFLMSRRNKIPLLFLSTLSLRRATRKIDEQCSSKPFLSTLSLRRATR